MEASPGLRIDPGRCLQQCPDGAGRRSWDGRGAQQRGSRQLGRRVWPPARVTVPTPLGLVSHTGSFLSPQGAGVLTWRGGSRGPTSPS